MTAVASAAAALGSAPVKAATIYWDGGANNTWNTSANWSLLSTAGSNADTQALASGDDVVFARAGSINRNTILDSAFSINSLTFSGSGTPVDLGTYAGVTQTLTIGTGGLTVNAGSGQVALLAGVNFALSGSQSTWANNSTNTLVVRGAVAAGTTNFIVTGTGNILLSGGLTSTSGTLSKLGSGTLTLSGAGSLGGATTIGGGTLALDYTADTSAKLASGASLTMNGGTVTFNGNASSVVNEAVNGLVVNSGANQITVTSNGQNTNLALGAISRTASSGATVNFTLPVLGNITTSSSNTNDIVAPWATVGGNSYATVSSGNIVAYTGATAATANLANVTSATTNYSYGAAVTLGGARTAYTLQYTGGSTTTAIGANTLTLNGLLNSGSGTLTITTSGTGNLAIGATGELVIGGPQAVTVSGRLSGTGDLVKFGSGTLTLSSTSNNFGGVGASIFINGGTLSFGNNLHLGSTSNTVVLRGGTLAYITTGTSSINRAIDIGSAPGSAISQSQGSGATETTYSGLFTGNNDFTFTTPGNNKYIVLSNTSNSFGGSDKALNLNGDSMLTVSSAAQLGNFGTINLNGMGLGARSGSGITLVQNIRGSGNIVADSGTSTTLTLDGAITSTGTLTFNTSSLNNQAQPNTAVGGANSLVILNGDLSGFTSGLTVSNGTVRVGSSATLPSSGLGLLTLANVAGAKFDMNNRDITVKGIATGGASGGNIEGNASGSAKTLTTDTTGTDRTYGGVISDGGAVALNLTKIGTNSQILIGTSTYTGATTINGGTLQLASATGKITGTTAITVRGGGTLVNGSTATNSNGGISNRINSSATLTLGGANFGGGTFTMGTFISETSSTHTQSLGSLTIDPGASTLNSNGTSSGASSSTITFTNTTGQLVRNSGGVVNSVPATNFTISFAAAPSLTNGILPYWTVDLNGSSSTPGNWATLNTSNAITAYSGYVTQTNLTYDESAWGSTVNLNLDVSSGSASKTLGGDRTLNSLRTAGAGASVTLNLGGNKFTIESGGLLLGNGGTNVTLNNGTLATATEFIVYQPIVGNTATINATINDGGVSPGAVKFTKSGGGPLILGSTSNLISDIYVNAGALTSAANGALGGTTGTLYIYGGARLNVQTAAQDIKDIVVGTGNASIVGLTALNFSVNNITLNDGAVLQFGPNSNSTGVGNFNFNGTVSGTGALKFGGATGSGIQATYNLLNANTYSGGTLLGRSGSGGGYAIAVGNNNAFGTGAISTDTTTTGINLVELRASTAGIALANNINWGNATALNLGGSNNLAFTGKLTISNDMAINVAGAGVHTFTGEIAQSGGTRALVKTGVGSLELAGPSTYTGATTIRNGNLLIAGNAPVSAVGALGNAASAVVLSDTSSALTDNIGLLTSAAITIDRNITVNANNTGGGLTTIGGNAAVTSAFTGGIALNRSLQLSQVASGRTNISGIISDASGTNAVTKAGLGTVNLTAANTYGGGTQVNAGTLLVNNTTGSGTGTGTVNVTTGTLGGVGIISGAVTVASGGTIAPGNSIGTLTINNALVLSGISDFEINASTMTNDSINGITALTYGGTLKITNLAGTLASGQSWDLFNGTYGSPTGTWANAAFIGTNGASDADIPDLGTGLIWNFNYTTGVLSIDALTTRYASISSSAAQLRRDDSPDTSTNDDAQGSGTQRVLTGIEVDGLNTDATTAASGSVLISPATGAGRTYIAMWLTGTTGAIDTLVAELDDDTAYLIRDIDSGETGGLTLAEWNYVQAAYAGNPQGAFNVLLAFDNITNPFFNWNFTGAGIGVDAVAVIPEPTSLALLGLGAVGLLARRRRK